MKILRNYDFHMDETPIWLKMCGKRSVTVAFVNLLRLPAVNGFLEFILVLLIYLIIISIMEFGMDVLQFVLTNSSDHYLHFINVTG